MSNRQLLAQGFELRQIYPCDRRHSGQMQGSLEASGVPELETLSQVLCSLSSRKHVEPARTILTEVRNSRKLTPTAPTIASCKTVLEDRSQHALVRRTWLQGCATRQGGLRSPESLEAESVNRLWANGEI